MTRADWRSLSSCSWNSDSTNLPTYPMRTLRQEHSATLPSTKHTSPTSSKGRALTCRKPGRSSRQEDQCPPVMKIPMMCSAPTRSSATGRRWPPSLKKDRKSVVKGKSVSVRVDIGGRRLIHKKKTKNRHKQIHNQNRR